MRSADALRKVWERLSLLRRVMLTAAIALIVAGGAVLAVSISLDAGFSRSRILEDYDTEQDALSFAIAEPAVIGDFASIEQTLREHVKRRDIQRILWISTKGKVIEAADLGVVLHAPALFVALADLPSPQGERELSIGGRDYGRIRVEMTAVPTHNRLWTSFLSHLSILGGALLIVFFGILLILKSGMRPLAALEEGARTLEAGELSFRIPPQGSPELACVVDAFNGMATTLESTQDHLRQFSLAIEQSPESVVITNLDAEIEYVNPAFLERTGYLHEQVIGQNPRVLQSGKTPRATHDEMWATLTAGKPWKGEFINRKANGEEYTESAIISPLRQNDGRISHYVAVKEDITARKRAEDDLINAKQRAEAANITKSRFLATMSHEIRTPMNGILGMAQILVMDNTSEPERRDYARTILNSGQSLLTLLNDILDFSKIEADKVEFEKAAFDPAQVLHETANLFHENAAAKGLQLEIKWDGTVQHYMADPNRLRQMLSNLTNNAIKFTSAGKVSLQAKEVERSEGMALVEFSVSDTGIGIDDDKQKLLFKPFSQTDNSITRQFGGTGLGLSIVRSLALKMGGDAGVESTLGEGSRFWFRIRADVVQAGIDQRHSVRFSGEMALSPEQLGRNILVVEDNPTNRKVIQAMLGKLGLGCRIAVDGQEGVRAVEQDPSIGLILMDVQMPIMNGYEATRAIRAWETETQRGRRPIIALTADAFDEDRQRCLEAGMDDFMTKPINLDKLKVILQQRLQGAIA